MKIEKLKNFKRGWVVGDFDPSLYKIENAEVGVQNYKQGEHHKEHYHKLATEINIVTNGHCLFLHPEDEEKDVWTVEGDITIIEPNEVWGFFALSDCTIVCIKTNSDSKDKYVCK